MAITNDQRRLLALCAIRVDQESVDWSLIAREAQFPEGLDALWNSSIQEKSAAAERSRPVLRAGIRKPHDLFARVDAEVEAAGTVGATLVTVLDPGYPANLRLVPNLPPFLFVRGELRDEDVRSVAVVGTREASEAGLRRAQRMSQMLAERGVTVISGLAKGIDAAAHRAALDAGGRTIAVFGTGITKCYPSENRGLAEEITGRGALVSQFWPTRSPGKDTFPRRNVVTSGLSQGTVVIEASRTSGAKMQARLALEHGKKVFLVKSLVTDQQWAKDYVAKRGAIEVADVDEVIRHLAAPERVRQAGEQRQQLTLASL
ncbi:MAG TPA: DNA-processing protein DprA [Acidimicrobiales bacterium]|nr:DNA-processing protein DprA [Acidimicrobiales bacterium]